MSNYTVQQLDDFGPYAGEGEIQYFERLAKQASDRRRQDRRRAIFGRILPLRRRVGSQALAWCDERPARAPRRGFPSLP